MRTPTGCGGLLTHSHPPLIKSTHRLTASFTRTYITHWHTGSRACTHSHHRCAHAHTHSQTEQGAASRAEAGPCPWWFPSMWRKQTLPSPALGDSWRLGRQRNFPEGHPTPAGQASLGPHQKSLRAALSSPWPPLTPPGAPLGLGLGWTPLQSSVGGCWAGREGAREGGKAAFSGETAKAGRTPPPKSVLFS